MIVSGKQIIKPWPDINNRLLATPGELDENTAKALLAEYFIANPGVTWEWLTGIRLFEFQEILLIHNQQTQKILLNLNWLQSTTTNAPTCFVILDDPFARWTRLVCDQFIKSNHSNYNLNEDDFLDFLLYNKVSCREITTLQKNIFQESRIFDKFKKIHFLKLDRKIGYTVNHLLHDYGVSNQFNNSLQLADYNQSNITKLTNFLYMKNNDLIENSINKDIAFKILQNFLNKINIQGDVSILRAKANLITESSKYTKNSLESDGGGSGCSSGCSSIGIVID
jgi:hypothetical protein